MYTPKFRTTVGVAAIAFACIALSSSCNRKDKNNTTTTTSTTTITAEDKDMATDQTLADNTFDDVHSIADKSMDVTSGGSMAWRTTSACAPTVTHYTDTTIIDFGTVNCTGADGRTRRGKIIVIHAGGSGHYADSGYQHTITFDNYYQNDNKITGTRVVTNMGHNSSGQLYFTVTVNGTITKSTGVVLVNTSNRTRTWISGASTHGNRTDDVYQVTGSGSITRTNTSGVTTTSSYTITAPLEIHGDCHYIEAGTIQMTGASGATRTINYGTTAVCDAVATLTLAGGTTVTITLP